MANHYSYKASESDCKHQHHVEHGTANATTITTTTNTATSNSSTVAIVNTRSSSQYNSQ